MLEKLKKNLNILKKKQCYRKKCKNGIKLLSKPKKLLNAQQNDRNIEIINQFYKNIQKKRKNVYKNPANLMQGLTDTRKQANTNNCYFQDPFATLSSF